MIIAGVVIIAVFIMIALYACCVASGRADEEEEKRYKEFLDEEIEPETEGKTGNKTAIVDNSFDN